MLCDILNTMITMFELLVRLLLAAALGGAIGWQRERTRHPAGMRTYALVSLGSAAFTLLSLFGFGVEDHVDPTRIASNILVGIGFLGAGIILHKGINIFGLTTAAAVWVSAAIGMATGAGQYLIAATVCVLTFILLFIDDDKIRGAGKK